MPAPTLRLVGVARHWGPRVALAPLDLDVAPGQRVALLGPSGAGKSTLLRILAASLRPTAGQVFVDDIPLQAASMRVLRRYRARCGIVEQHDALVPQLDVHHNVAAGLLPRRSAFGAIWSLLAHTDVERVAAVLREVGLADRQWDPVTALSGGQRQRVAIARALVGDPDIVLADEPTAALDPATAADVLTLLVDRAAARGATLVVSTHHFDQVRDRVDRVIGVRAGRVAFDLPPRRVTQGVLADLYAGSLPGGGTKNTSAAVVQPRAV